MSDTGTFGGANRYYDAPIEIIAAKRPWPPRETESEGMIRNLLADSQPDLADRVRRVVKQWNLALRDLIRTETALRLSQGDDRQAVPVEVQDGLPRPLANLVNEFPDPLIWKLVLHLPLLQATVAGLRLTLDNLPAIRKWPPLRQQQLLFFNECGDEENLLGAKWFMERLVKELEKLSLIDRLKGINEDILGAYFFRIPKIRIYWMVIGLVASLLEVSVEGLTIVVLAHELAHAYTHLGKDIDGLQWKTEDFARASLCIVEGLAQFYTAVVCRRLEEKQPEAFRAYEKLLGMQGGPYLVHQDWGENDQRAGEVVRVSMIYCRSNGIKNYELFLQEIARAQDSLGNRLGGRGEYGHHGKKL